SRINTLAIVVVVLGRREGHAAKHFSGLSSANRDEVAQRIIPVMVAIRERQRGSSKPVSDFYQLVRIGALIATGADGRSDCKDLDRAVAMDSSSQIAAATCRGIERGWIVRNAVGDADVQAVLQNVEQVPGAVREAPFLDPGCGLTGGVGDVPVDR